MLGQVVDDHGVALFEFGHQHLLYPDHKRLSFDGAIEHARRYCHGMLRGQIKHRLGVVPIGREVGLLPSVEQFMEDRSHDIQAPRVGVREDNDGARLEAPRPLASGSQR